MAANKIATNGQVYFAQCLTTMLIKVGFSTNVPKRMRQLMGVGQGPLRLLATIDGNVFRERDVHDEFASLRMGGWHFGGREWFRPEPSLILYILEHGTPGTLPDFILRRPPSAAEDFCSRHDREMRLRVQHARTLADEPSPAMAERH